MSKIKLSFIALAILALTAFKSDKPAYQIFAQGGKAVKYEKMLETLQEADIVFFGEQHNDPIGHWLQFELTKDIYTAKGKDLIVGAEMFETDNQILIDEYFNGNIKQKNFESEVRLWPNYKTDYKQLLEFAKDSGLQFIATNIPRRYAALVNEKGFEGLDSLSLQAKGYIAKLPIEYDTTLACYKNILDMMKDSPHVNENLPKAQAAKDATMAEFILKNWSDGKLFLHYNGSYHSDDFESILWYLYQSNPDLKIITISSVEQNNIDTLEEENINKANYILAIPSSMTKTY